MKKVSFLVLMVLCYSIAKSTITESTTKGSIGRKSQDCKGLGLCIADSKSKSNLDLLFQYDQHQQVLIIAINEKQIMQYQPDVMQYLIHANSFVFQEDVDLPFSLVTALGLPIHVLRKAEYSLKHMKGQFIISIPIA